MMGIMKIFAQTELDKQALIERISCRDSIMAKVSKKDMVDTLKMQVKDYSKLIQIVTKEADECSGEKEALKKELNKFVVLTSEDTLVFNQDFDAYNDIPKCLQERVLIIKSIIGLRTKVLAAETIAKGLEKTLGDSPVAYAAIREKIEADLESIQTLIHDIKGMNLSTLSDEQQKYFRPGLTDRYNSFKKYF